MIKDDGTVIHFNNPKVQASLAANTFAVTGHAENKQITEMLPGILNQLGADSLTHLKRLASGVAASNHAVAGGMADGNLADNDDDDDDDEVPDLVENFDEVSKNEATTTTTTTTAADESKEAKISDVTEEEAKKTEEAAKKTEEVAAAPAAAAEGAKTEE